MNKQEIITRVMNRLSQYPLYQKIDTKEEENRKNQNCLDPRDIVEFGNELKKIYKKYQNNYEQLDFPKAILNYVGSYMDEFHPEREDKIKLLNEVKKNKLFNFNLNKNLERAWRVILKNWDIRNYRLEGGL